MKILLAYRSGRAGAGDYFATMMPVGLGYINAALRAAGFDSRLANLSRVPWAEAVKLLKVEKPGLVGLTLYTFNRHAALKLAVEAKRANPRCFVVAGGPHAAHVAESLLTSCSALDAVATGEGETLMVDLARCLERGGDPKGVAGLVLRDTGATAPREAIASLDDIPFPAPHYEGFHLDVTAEAGFIITSRGCPGRCTFCNTPDFWGTKMRFRSAASVLDEIRFLARERGILYVSVRDDTFTVHKKRILELCERLCEAKLGVLWNCQSRVNAIDQERLDAMRRAGCEVVQYGVESGSPRLLRELAKDISVDQIRSAAAATRRAGMSLSFYLISGVPGETDGDFRATESLLKGCRPHDAMVAPLALYPGTALWEAYKSERGVTDDYWVKEKRDTLYALPARERARSNARMAAICRAATSGRARGGRRLGATTDLARHGSAAVPGGETEDLAVSAAYTREDLEAHKERHPEAFAPLLSSGLAYESEGLAGEALTEYEAILALEPKNPWALHRTAAVLTGTGDPESALMYAADLAREHPKYAAGHALVAAIHLAAARRGKTRDAARAAKLLRIP
ncbi:MAG: radical SAM protein [Acidobacteria bacterium]|nr:radical SAM protein [Acidobacteriota bacterium]